MGPDPRSQIRHTEERLLRWELQDEWELASWVERGRIVQEKARVCRRFKFKRPYSGPSEKAMAPHSSTLAWKIPWMEEPGRLQSMGSLRVQHDWVTSLSISCIGEGNGDPFQCSCLENPRDRGAWWAAVYGVTQSRTWLKRLSSSRIILFETFIYNCAIHSY